MEFDSFETLLAEQLRSNAVARGEGQPARLVLTEATAAVVVIAAAALLPVLFPIHRPVAIGISLLALAVYLICDRVMFPVGSAYTSASQLAFIPMLVLVPGPLVPGLVILARLLPLVVKRLRGERTSATAALARIGDCAYALGPVLVLLAAGRHTFVWADWPIYAAALAAQFLVDFTCGATRTWLTEGETPGALLPIVGWLYFVDACLTCVALYIAATVSSRPGLVVLILPLVALLALFARERKQRLQSSLTLSETYRETAELLGEVLEDDEPLTGVHSREVAELAMAVAERLELDPLGLFNVRYGALLHDVGKISVPKSILQKPGKLTPEEWKIMREHTVRGQEMLDRVGGSLRAVGRIVRHSHEHFDGRGYPDGLSGEAIPVESRIVAAADAWNAMTTSRPYRRALSVEVAADEMKRCSGSHFDPEVVVALLHEVAPAYCSEPPLTSQLVLGESTLADRPLGDGPLPF